MSDQNLSKKPSLLNSPSNSRHHPKNQSQFSFANNDYAMNSNQSSGSMATDINNNTSKNYDPSNPENNNFSAKNVLHGSSTTAHATRAHKTPNAKKSLTATRNVFMQGISKNGTHGSPQSNRSISTHSLGHRHANDQFSTSNSNITQKTQSYNEHRNANLFERNCLMPEYSKNVQDYKSIKIGIKILGNCDNHVINFVRKQLSRKSKKIDITINNQTRSISVKYKIINDISSDEPPFFQVLQSHRKLFGIILVSQASNPLNVALMQNEFEQIVSDTKNETNIVSVKWLVFSSFDRSLNTVANATILQMVDIDDNDSLDGHDGRYSRNYDYYEEDNLHGTELTENDTLVRLASVSKELITEVVTVLEEQRLAPEGHYDVYLEGGSIALSTASGSSSSNASKRQLQGRHRKHVGDLCMLTGMLKEALLNYHASIDLLRAINDGLWLACALESSCIASAIQMEEDPSSTLFTVETIFDKLCESIKLYSRFKQAGILEIETSCVAARLINNFKKPLEATSFAHNAVYRVSERFSWISFSFCR